MKVIRNQKGDLRLENMPALCVDTFVKLPAWLEEESPSVRERLLPRASADPDAEMQWRRYAVPDLEHLFMSRIEIIRKDLATLQSSRSGTFSMQIPEAHQTAWLSALNGARQALFILNELEPRDMERDLDELDNTARDEARLRIAVLGWLQQLLIEVGA
jgi:hypothetical protein